MEVKTITGNWGKRKNFLGQYITLKHEAFFLKLFFLMLGSCSFILLDIQTSFGKIKVVILLVIVILDGFFFRKQAMRFLQFAVIASIFLLIIWCLFVRPSGGPIGIQSCIETLQSVELRNAFFRFLGIFAVGLLFAGGTTQYEVLFALKKYKLPVSVSLFCILLWNSFACFLNIFREISLGLDARWQERKPIKRIFFIITTMAFEAMQMIVDCKKMFFLHSHRIIDSITWRKKELCKEPNEQSNDDDCSLDIEFSEIKYVEQETELLHEAKLEGDAGHIILLTGENGCGKTTLLNLISGIIPEIINASYKKEENGDLKPEEIGFVFQGINNSIFFETAETQLAHISTPMHETWLKKFGLLYDDLYTRAIVDFSSGEQQKLSLIAELLDDSKKICLLDEPTAFLDENGKTIFFELLQYVSRNKIVIIVSHDKRCMEHCNRFYQIVDGKLREGIWEPKIKPFSINFLADLKRKKIFDFPYDKLEKGNLELRLGDFICITGDNGAGKTTFAKTLFQEVSKKNSQMKCAFMLQRPERQLFQTTVLSELLLGTQGNERSKDVAYSFLKKVGMEKLADEPPQFLSGGQKRTLLILCMLIQEPDLLILDEPLSSLDLFHADIIIEMLISYYEEKHPCIIICDQLSSRSLSICEQTLYLSK